MRTRPRLEPHLSPNQTAVEAARCYPLALNILCATSFSFWATLYLGYRTRKLDRQESETTGELKSARLQGAQPI